VDLDQLARALDVFKTLDPDQLPAHRIRLFLEIAVHGPITYKELEERLVSSNASVSRGVQSLSDEREDGRPGLGLVEAYKDPGEGRRFLVRLSAKGKRVLKQLEGIQ
jgi:DNA-binding MarR family transcriptional regulator